MSSRYGLTEIGPDQIGAHVPPADADESWQESWGFSWHDPVRRAGGINHLSVQRNRGIADVWSWVALDGKVVGKYQCLNLDPPEQDLPDWSLGGQTVTEQEARSCCLRLAYESGTSADLRYQAFTDPLAFSFDVEGSTWGASHYESMGRVDGTVTVGGEPTRVSGFGWQDHSWGSRHWADTLSHRWIMAVFGPELFVSAISLVTEAGPLGVPVGFVYEDGELHDLERVSFATRIGDDGHTPLGCDARIWTTTGHGYHVTGETHAASPSSHLEGFWFTDALCVYELGGRLGAGILEVQELNRPAPWHRAQLGLDIPGALPSGDR